MIKILGVFLKNGFRLSICLANIFSPTKLSHATRLVQDDLGNLLMMIMTMMMMMMIMMVVYVGGVGSCDGLSKTHFFLSHCPLSPLPSGLMWILPIEFFVFFSVSFFLAPSGALIAIPTYY